MNNKKRFNKKRKVRRSNIDNSQRQNKHYKKSDKFNETKKKKTISCRKNGCANLGPDDGGLSNLFNNKVIEKDNSLCSNEKDIMLNKSEISQLLKTDISNSFNTLKNLLNKEKPPSLTNLSDLTKLYCLSYYKSKQNDFPKSSDFQLYNSIINFSTQKLPALFLRYTENLKMQSKFEEAKKTIELSLLTSIKILNNISLISLIRSAINCLKSSFIIIDKFNYIKLKLMNAMLKLWAIKDLNIITKSFLLINLCINKNKKLLLSEFYKSSYVYFCENSKEYNENNYKKIHLLMICMIIMSKIDINKSQQTQYKILSDIGIKLRKKIYNNSSNGNKREVDINKWSTINLLFLIGRTISMENKRLISLNKNNKFKNERLKLIHSFVSILLGVINEYRSSNYFPLRLIICEILVDVSESLKMSLYIPVGSSLLGILSHLSVIKKNGVKKEKEDCRDFVFIIKLEDKKYSEIIRKKSYNLLIRYLSVYSYSICFPEFIFPIVLELKKIIDETDDKTYRKQIVSLVKIINDNSEWIKNLRSKINTDEDMTGKLDKFLEKECLEGRCSPISKKLKGICLDKGDKWRVNDAFIKRIEIKADEYSKGILNNQKEGDKNI